MTVIKPNSDLDELKSLAVLYVEDDPDVREQLVESLKRRVGQLWVAEDGRQGLALFREHRPEMVVTDILMPGMNGLDMAAVIRDIDPSVPILVTTAFEQVDYLLRSLDLGIDQYITKPVDVVQLYARMGKCARLLRSERMLRESEERFRSAMEYAPIGMAIVSPEGKLLKVNAALCDIVGYSAAELEALTIQDITFPDDRVADEVKRQEMLQGGIGTYRLEKRYIHKDGPIISALLTVSLLRDEKGTSIHCIDQVMDITDRKRLEMEIRRLNESLEKRGADEVLRNREQDLMENQHAWFAVTGQLIDNIAPRWKQPINDLSIILTNLKDDLESHKLSPDKYGETLTRAHRLLEDMAATFENISTFFRPDREAAGFDIDKAVELALNIAAASLKNHQIEVAQTLATGLKTYGYPTQFAHAVLNLISNAIERIEQHATPSGRRIEIRLGEENARARLTVQDGDGGIAEDVLARIFDPYFTTKDQGNGLFLYTTKVIIERNHHGTLTAENLDQGARFIVSLPLWMAS